MAKTPLSNNSEFTVGEEIILDYIMAFLFLALFLYGLIDAIVKRFHHLTYLSGLFTLALLPAIYFYKKARSKRIYIRVNKTGIYQDERLVTDWSHLLNAYITERDQSFIISVSDNFALVIEYQKNNADIGARRYIKLTNTQNKSEEDVLEAVHFFWREYQKNYSL